MSTFEHAKFSAQEPLKQSSGLDPVNEASAGRRGTETCPASGCMMPCTCSASPRPRVRGLFRCNRRARNLRSSRGVAPARHSPRDQRRCPCQP
eukprot:scaffold74826_cov40-Tisochrysis_lutea.AAC.1